jgi:glycerol-3-phosphate acyltransferase PlsX
MLPIALDAMGGDHAPDAVVEGARRARDDHGIEVVLVGPPDGLGDHHGLPVIAASEVIGMADDPGSSVRRRKDATVVRAAEAVRDHHAAATVSAGNTGAAMASALFRIGRLRGVARPAIATPIPSASGPPTVLLDAGANAECQAPWLVQFAQLGSVYARRRYGVEAPRVGLLSIGEEPGKGNSLTREAHGLLSDDAWSGSTGATFVGNVEGRDIMSADVDVVVTDGFTGNVVLKALEGGIGAVLDRLRAVMDANDQSRTAVAPILPGLTEIFHDLDPDTYGAALLLGVKGVSLISHGASSAGAICNALRTAVDLVEMDLVTALADAVGPADD